MVDFLFVRRDFLILNVWKMLRYCAHLFHVALVQKAGNYGSSSEAVKVKFVDKHDVSANFKDFAQQIDNFKYGMRILPPKGTSVRL